jgi:terminal uridylyltransferase
LAPSNRANVQAQIDYLDTLAFEQIPKVEISHEEFAEKQALRFSLEQVCRKTVSDWEIAHKDPNFVVNNVELKCFGSLSTTFATKSSDMDLVVVSPSSSPSPSAPESELPRSIEKALLDMGYGARLLTRTRVPIIKFCEKPSPELAKLLLEERLKWEKERDKPPKAPQKKEKKQPETVKEDGPDPILPQSQPDNLPENSDDLHNSIPNHSNESPKASAPVSLNVQDNTTTLSDDAEQSDKKTDGRGGNPPPTMEKEGANPSLLAKSEGELTRLYRLAMLEGWYKPAERQIINTFIQAVERNGTREDVKAKARSCLQELPNVLGRYRAPPEAHCLDFPKTGVGIQCDINFSNHLALHNSHLLKCYSLCDSRVRRMVLFVKAWSKKRKINTPYHGTLSSYGYVLMVLHYLVNIANPPVVPNLQRMPQAFQDELSSEEISFEGHDTRFFRNEKAIEELRRNKEITVNEESVGSLLRGFFHYFAQQGYTSPSGGFHWTLDTLSLRTIGGILPKQTKGWTGAKTETVKMAGPGPTQTKEVRQRYLFAIEDPFEIEHNVARTVVHNGIVAIRNEFRRAHRLIEDAGYIRGKGLEDLFAEAEDKENLQYRAFGPRPRDQGAAKGAGKKADEHRNGGNGRSAPTPAGSSVGQSVTVQQQQ